MGFAMVAFLWYRLSGFREFKTLKNNTKWINLHAIQKNEVYAVNATEYFSKPGPRTITGLEILAKIINPTQFADLEVPYNSFERITNTH
jgi:iron complex transport system substrate-binding protein